MFPNLYFLAEEVRVELIELMDLMLETNEQQFVTQVSPICTMLGKVVADSNPDMKSKSATFSGKIALTLGKKIGQFMGSPVESLMANLTHQHSKVRRTTLKGLRDVMCCKGAEQYLGENALL